MACAYSPAKASANPRMSLMSGRSKKMSVVSLCNSSGMLATGLTNTRFLCCRLTVQMASRTRRHGDGREMPMHVQEDINPLTRRLGRVLERRDRVAAGLGNHALPLRVAQPARFTPDQQVNLAVGSHHVPHAGEGGQRLGPLRACRAG